MRFVRLSEELTVNAASVLYSREDEDGGVALTFGVLGPDAYRHLQLDGEEAQAWKNYLDSLV